MQLTNSILLEKLIVPRLANKHPALKGPPPPSLQYAAWPTGKNTQLSTYFFKTYFNISLPDRNYGV
jgi:hypothetical protein